MNRNGNNAPPYGTYGTFDKFCEELKNTAVPDHIDRSMLHKLSGAAQTALLAGLLFLGLIEENDDGTTDSFHRLIKARKESQDAWKAALGEIVTTRYESIVSGMNIETTTKTKIEERFRAAGVSPGQMTTKSVRFYLKAAEQSGGTISPHLRGMRGRIRRTTRGTPRRKAAGHTTPPSQPQQSSPEQFPKADQAPDGFARLPVPGLEGAFIQYPANLTKAHITLLQGGVAYLETSVKVREEEGIQ